MEKLWVITNKLKISKEHKTTIFLSAMTISSGFVGLLLWWVMGQFLLSDLSWKLCFIGYPSILYGVLGSTIYIYNHEFDDK